MLHLWHFLKQKRPNECPCGKKSLFLHQYKTLNLIILRRIVNLILLLFLAIPVCLAQNSAYIFNNLNSQNGLTENNVKSIVQDHWGFMWFGTKNGLNRYDGTSMKHYNVDDPMAGKQNNNCSALFNNPADHKLWVGTDKGVFIFDPYLEKFTFFDVKADDGQSISNWIQSIVGDKAGNIWIISPEEGAYRYNTATKKLRRYTNRTAKGENDNPQCLCVRQDGTVWLGTYHSGIFRYDIQKDRLTHFATTMNGQPAAANEIFCMTDYGQQMVLGEHEGRLLKLNPTTRELQTVDAPDVHYKVIRSLLYDGKQLFVGTQAGIYVINEKLGLVNHIEEDHFQPFGLSDNIIYSLYRDRDDGIWVGTNFNGVDYLARKGMVFHSYIPSPVPGSLSSRRIREMASDKLGRVWIASEEGRLDIYNPVTRVFERVPTAMYQGGSNRMALMADGDWMWSGLFKNGLDIINIHTKAINHFTPTQLGLEEGSVYALLRDRKGKVWMGTGRGVYVQREGMAFDRVKGIQGMFIQDLTEDKDGHIWVASMGSGVFDYDPATGKNVNYVHDDSDGSISSSSVSSITIDSRGDLWFSTDRGGISRFDRSTRKFVNYSKADGLPDDVAYKILEDKNHNLWFGSNNGVVCFNPETKAAKVYRSTNSQITNQHNYKSAIKLSDNRFIIGGLSGIVEFNPELAQTGKQTPRILISNLRVNGRELWPEENGVLKQNIFLSNEVSLPHDMSSISLDVSTLNFSGTETNVYEYMLEGVDRHWVTTDNGHGIAYAQLQPGDYTFRVRLQGNEASTAELQIEVRHPWYSSLPARVVYVLLVIALIYYIARTHQRRQMNKLRRREQQFQATVEKEQLKSKIDFFTDITHEIRTPLTLINGSLENIGEAKVDNPVVSRNLNAIRKNSQRLLNLINQLLDFRKMDANAIKPDFTMVDVSQLLRNIIERFEPTISQQHKTLSTYIDDEQLVIPVDREGFTKIMSNLLNNAMKYSETFIQVETRQKDGKLVVTVINDGDKIPQEKAAEVFKPFVQLDNSHVVPGSGIGLPLARSLAEMHHGTLDIDTSSEYNKFVLTLPTEQDHVITIAATNDEQTLAAAMVDTSLGGQPKPLLDNSLVEDYDFTGVKPKEYTLLLVEDNEDVLAMVSEKLGDHYNLLKARNGQEGLDLATKEHVDLIVSDIMMPVMDGLEMTRAIKENIEINHIPIILLTAKQTLHDHLEGLQVGADAYIEKPFSMVHLLQQIETLLANRKRERENFAHKPYLSASGPQVNKQKEEFLSKITKLVLQHIKEPEFNVEQLAAEMCMSRSSLHRKIKEVSDMTPIDFIRIIRLKKAAELMREQGYRASEVCEMVGINSHSYFIKLFQKQFGMTPKEFTDQKA